MARVSSSAPGPGPSPKSSTSRREAILAAALELFRTRGFHGVGIDEIGQAAGITGPGVYRHFPSKDSLLVALFDEISEQMLAASQKIVAQVRPPGPTLERLVRLHVTFATDERGLLTVWVQDWRSLPGEARERIAGRFHEYMGYWCATLAAARPDLTPEERELVAFAATGAVNSVALYECRVPSDILRPRLERIALGVLEAG